MLFFSKLSKTGMYIDKIMAYVDAPFVKVLTGGRRCRKSTLLLMPMKKLCVQVTQGISSEKTEKREYNRLLEIHDNYPKYVLNTDHFAGGNYEGIKTMHAADFLLSSEY